MNTTRVKLAGVLAAAIMLQPAIAEAGLFKLKPQGKAPAAATVSDTAIAEIQRAFDEDRLTDAGKMLEQAALREIKDPRLTLMGGYLSLARGRYQPALDSFRAAEKEPVTKAKALEGQGIALSVMNRSDEAIAKLKEAVALDPAAWKAWNALASEYDSRGDWPQAEAAYERAVSLSSSSALALNNRGFSRLLQRRPDEAIPDFVAALQKNPGMAAARTNLRMAMAMRGDYDRSIAGSTQENEAATLNNAGFAAMMRGDYAQAENLLERAMKARGEYYSRASANLELTRSLKAHGEGRVNAP